MSLLVRRRLWSCARAVVAGPIPMGRSTFARTTLRPQPVRGFVGGSLTRTDDAVEIIDHTPGRATNDVILTCEHASNRLPEPYAWPAADRRLVTDHWAYDPGAEDFTRELRERINAVAVLSRYSRLLLDPNRPLNSETLIRTTADGKPIALNASVTPAERLRRIDRFYRPYHSALHSVAAKPERSYKLILSLHSYTPNYEGQKRDVQIGVLFSGETDELATKVKGAFGAAGHDARLNEPWSGRGGYMYAAESIVSPGSRALMLEFRNDLVTQRAWRAATIDQLVAVLAANNFVRDV